MPTATADALIVLWLPGGISCSEFFDPRPFTPYEPGMKGSDVLGVCRSIPTSVDGLSFGEGLDEMASVMHLGTLVKSLSEDHRFDFDHTREQFHMLTGFTFPAGFKPPSIASVISRTLGRRHPDVPAAVDMGVRALDGLNSSDGSTEFVDEIHGPGFYGVKHAPFYVADPRAAIRTLKAVSGMSMAHLDERLELFRKSSGLAPDALQEAQRFEEYTSVIESSREMMDSPLVDAFKYRTEESEETISQYETGSTFGLGCLVARRMIEKGARFVKVNYPFRPFSLIDTHHGGAERNALPKQHIDRPIAQLVRDLEERGLLERTLVVVLTEFGRTLAGDDGINFTPEGEKKGKAFLDGETIRIEDKRFYGFHGHFARRSNALFYGGGFKRGFSYGRAADRHPMFAIEDVMPIADLHASIYHAMGIAPDVYFTSEERPIHVTNLGQGRPVHALYA